MWDLAVGRTVGGGAAIYRWYMPLLHLDTHVKFVHYIKLAIQECGLGAEWVRAAIAPGGRGAGAGAGDHPAGDRNEAGTGVTVNFRIDIPGHGLSSPCSVPGRKPSESNNSTPYAASTG